MGKRKRIEKRYEKVVPGKDKIVTGIEKIDEVFKGGYKNGEIPNRKSDFSHFMS